MSRVFDHSVIYTAQASSFAFSMLYILIKHFFYQLECAQGAIYIIKGYKKWKENESKIKLYSPFIHNSVDQP